MREILINAYLDWKNNYLSIAHYAECNGLTERQAWRLLELAKEVFDSPHPDQ